MPPGELVPWREGRAARTELVRTETAITKSWREHRNEAAQLTYTIHNAYNALHQTVDRAYGVDRLITQRGDGESEIAYLLRGGNAEVTMGVVGRIKRWVDR